MPTIEIFEAPTSAKRPAPDFGYKAFESMLQWLESEGVKVQRYTLPGDNSSSNSTVKSAFEAQGPDCLPIVTVDDNIISVGGYPTPIELMQAAGQSAGSAPKFLGMIAMEAAALGAAIAANDFEGFHRQWEHLRSFGILEKDVTQVVQSSIVSAGVALRDDMRTRVEQLLAFGPQGKPPKPPCACGNNL